MELKTDDSGNKYFSEFAEVKPTFYPIKVRNILQFYTLKSRKTVISKDNVIPMINLNYAIYSSGEEKYYWRIFHNWTLEQAYFYRKSLDFSGEDQAIENLHRYIYDGNVWILMASDEVKYTSEMLKRLWKSQFLGIGKLPYYSWINLLSQSLDYEDYREYGRELVGFRTVCNQYTKRIRAIWDEAYKTQKTETK